MRLLGGRTFPEHHLRHSGGVAQIDEDHATVVTPPGHPAAEGDGLTGVLASQRTSQVGAQHDVPFDECGTGTPPGASHRSETHSPSGNRYRVRACEAVADTSQIGILMTFSEGMQIDPNRASSGGGPGMGGKLALGGGAGGLIVLVLTLLLGGDPGSVLGQFTGAQDVQSQPTAGTPEHCKTAADANRYV